jgi:hypothetical protein
MAIFCVYCQNCSLLQFEKRKQLLSYMKFTELKLKPQIQDGYEIYTKFFDYSTY